MKQSYCCNTASIGQGEFPPVNGLETTLSWGQISTSEKAKNNKWKEIIVNLKKLKMQWINTLKMERNNCEFANIESLRGERIPPAPSDMAINSTYEYQEMERNNHTSADIESLSRGKFSPVNRLETSLCLGKFPPMKRLK